MRCAHPIARALERYNAVLTPGDLDTIKALVLDRRPEALPLGPRPDGTFLIAVRYKPADSRRRWFATVWRDADILTILPPRSLMFSGGRLSARRAELIRLGLDDPRRSRSRDERVAERRACEVAMAWAAHREGVPA